MDALPIELISHIFALGAFDLGRRPHWSYPDLVQFRAVVSAVDTLWRNVALSTPLLWSTLAISLQHGRLLHGPSDSPAIFTFLGTLLDRSRDVPLELIFRDVYDNVGFSEDFLFWKVIGPHLPRCKCLTIGTSYAPPPIIAPLSQLETLEVLTWREGSDEPVASRLLGPQLDIANLRNLRVEGWCDPPFLARTIFAINAANLRRLTICDDAPQDLSHVLGLIAECRSLVYLELWIYPDETTDDHGGAVPFVMDHLMYLGTDDTNLFHYLSAPNLQFLDVEYDEPTFLDYLPSFPRLTVLTMELYTVDQHGYPSQLWDVPVLEVQRFTHAGTVFEALINRVRRNKDPFKVDCPPRCPRLIRLGRHLFTGVNRRHETWRRMLHALALYPQLHISCHQVPERVRKRDYKAFASRLTILSDDVEAFEGPRFRWEHSMYNTFPR